MAEKRNIYFASDFHLGLKTGSSPKAREKKVVGWLESIAADAGEIYLIGDIFDFWWEYRLVVPKGYTRFLGTISCLTDSGVKVHFFTGNHDMWVKDYLSTECGMIIHTGPYSMELDGKKFHLAHGEGLGSDDRGYAILLSIFRNKPLRMLYSALHPSIGMGIGHRWSLNSRLAKGVRLEFLGEEKEALIKYARSVLNSGNSSSGPDYFIFGHRHLAMTYRLKEGSEIVFLGDWINGGSYACWNGMSLDFRTVD
ncbi:MAG TPA: UDP-2,3-diacylglucosamine diphosphatase [Bacteroidales bacterium]|nr:UDP-2,3-diacylglucosamine diphosphatase [Bacteroidales bacterium]